MARATKQEANNQDRRGRILDAARKLIAEHAFEATSTKAIAAKAGVPSGLVFYYFETKDDLVEAIFDECPLASETAIAKAKNQSRPLEVLLRTYYDEITAHRYQTQIVVAAVASGHPITPKVLAMRRRAEAQLADFFRSQSNGKTAIAPEVLARVVNASMITAVLLDGPRDVSSFLRGLTSVVKCGLAPA